ncbi:GNAT family N-acetyltransferase [Rhodococcoides kroppenstedtii]|uniref:GNAT family N-acetyltransferase n=1 Tax=Rhodococcoides kroppenstedtii TaxID=293050 RepID=UPI0028E56C91|nr:N-acetyltransferase [Rhodococcus kroppenstedtii]
MRIRREQPSDRPDVLRVVHEAFESGPDEPGEVALTRALFDDPGYIPAFSLVAVVSGDVAGYVIGTRGYTGDTPAVGIAPLAVARAHQRRGVGSALIGTAQARHEPALVLLGENAYYERFDFAPASRNGIEAPVASWGRHFQALVLTDDPVAGRFRYTAAFGL